MKKMLTKVLLRAVGIFLVFIPLLPEHFGLQSVTFEDTVAYKPPFPK